MVVKTEVCFFTELKIYPGHGKRMVRKDGRLLMFIDGKCNFLNEQKIKAQRLRWTQAWRRANKKVKAEAIAKKKVKKVTKVMKAVGGLDIEELKARRNNKSDFRKKVADDAERAAKERARLSKEAAAKAKKDKKKGPKPVASFVKNQPKVRQSFKVLNAK